MKTLFQIAASYIHSDAWHVSVEKCYNESKDIYYSTEGYVLFHEDVNSKALIDMQRNEFMPLGEHDWFTVGKDEELEDSDDEELSENDIYDSESTYISKNDDGVPVGFTKNWSVSKNGVTCYSSYSHFTDDVDMLREIASEIGIELQVCKIVARKTCVLKIERKSFCLEKYILEICSE